jgi:hypothetical protein
LGYLSNIEGSTTMIRDTMEMRKRWVWKTKVKASKHFGSSPLDSIYHTKGAFGSSVSCEKAVIICLLWDARCKKAESRLVQTAVSCRLWKSYILSLCKLTVYNISLWWPNSFSFKSLFLYIWKYLELTFFYFLFLFSYIWKSLFSYI